MKLKFMLSGSNMYREYLYIYIGDSVNIESKYKILFKNDGGVFLKVLDFVDLSICEKNMQKIRGVMRNPKIIKLLKRCIQDRRIPSDISTLTGGLFSC